ncbi:MAG TPA: hypothetical protein VII92_16160, partial [Anaerolineae bacterium]
LAKHFTALYLAVKSAAQPPDVGGEIAIQDFGEGIEMLQILPYRLRTPGRCYGSKLREMVVIPTFAYTVNSLA